jgi:putative transposase
MIAFIDDHRGAFGVEPICRVLRIAPSSYHACAAKPGGFGQGLSSKPTRRGALR